MKKIFTLLSAFALSATVYSQGSLQLIDPDNFYADVTNGTINIYSAPGVDAERILDVKNVSSTNKLYKLKRTFISGVFYSAPPEDTSAICWNACLPAVFTQTQTTGNLQIAAGATASFSGQSQVGFHSSFKSNNTLGTRTVRYTWWDVNNTSDSTTVIINYHITGVNISEQSLKHFNFSNPQPNPAVGNTVIRYDFPQVAKAKIKVYNAVGTMMKEVKIEDANGKVTISTDELSNGIYFYSLIVNDRIVGTKKLIVAN